MQKASPAIPFTARSTAADVVAGLDLAGRTILVTGCNSGIGFETMRALAARGAHIVALARSEQAALDAGRRAGAAVTPVACDQSDLASVAAAIAKVRALDARLDAIVANAGIMGGARQRVYGIEKQFLVNHVAHFLLVTRLADRLADASGRVVMVSSRASVELAPREGIMFDNLDAHAGYRSLRFYGQSKLANALFAVELARRLAPRGIVANAVHPGVIMGTSLMRGFGVAGRAFASVARHFTTSPAEGAATQTLLAASPLVEGITGRYWSDCRPAEGSRFLQDKAMAERLWTVTEAIVAGTGVVVPPPAL
jgi:WW domain-containing oxidoreductase